ncbi:MAG TPA: hypothetical protein VGI47_05095, partial [Candidatus Binataceae bacterium]
SGLCIAADRRNLGRLGCRAQALIGRLQQGIAPQRFHQQHLDQLSVKRYPSLPAATSKRYFPTSLAAFAPLVSVLLSAARAATPPCV